MKYSIFKSIIAATKLIALNWRKMHALHPLPPYFRNVLQHVVKDGAMHQYAWLVAPTNELKYACTLEAAQW